jgi:hypothetical protein
MARTTRRLAVLVAIGGILAMPRGAAAERLQVRSHSAAFVAAIHEAGERSETFRGLLTTINAGPDIVYVEEGRCSYVGACLVSVVLAADYRVLTIRVDPKKSGWDLASSIGHELYHATEVLSDRRVTTLPRLYAFYLRTGLMERRMGFETQGAIDAGDAIRDEFRKSSATAPQSR